MFEKKPKTPYFPLKTKPIFIGSKKANSKVLPVASGNEKKETYERNVKKICINKMSNQLTDRYRVGQETYTRCSISV